MNTKSYTKKPHKKILENLFRGKVIEEKGCVFFLLKKKAHERNINSLHSRLEEVMKELKGNQYT
jgi:hypothetical protein